MRKCVNGWHYGYGGYISTWWGGCHCTPKLYQINTFSRQVYWILILIFERITKLLILIDSWNNYAGCGVKNPRKVLDLLMVLLYGLLLAPDMDTVAWSLKYQRNLTRFMSKYVILYL